VLNESGEPIAGASVAFVKGPVALPDIAQLTGPDGAFSLGAPAPGDYRLGVHAPGHEGREQDVRVGKGKPREVVVRLKPA
jgi:hypothetical protein